MPFWNRPATKWIGAVLGTAAYFAAAGWLKCSYVDRSPHGKIVVQLLPPFEPVGGYAFVANNSRTDVLDGFGDDAYVVNDARSPVTIYEDQKPIGPAHSNFANISQLGLGRYYHLKGRGVTFSSSDNSNPNRNRRYYWAVLPD